MERISNKKIFEVYERVMGQRIDPRDKADVVKFATSILSADRWRERDIARRQAKNPKQMNKTLGKALINELEKKGACKVCGLIDGCSVGCGE